MMEFIATWFLMLTIYLVAVNKTKPGDELDGLLIGLSITLGIFTIGPWTGAALNPMRVFGPAFINGDLWRQGLYNYQYLVYGIGPMLGGATCGGMWRLIFMDKGKTGMALSNTGYSGMD